MHEAKTALPETLAAVDLGSNSFHLIVARLNADDLIILDRLREMVQLAAGLDRSKHLSKDAMARALDCLRRFGERVRHMPSHAVRAVGTNTLRTAKNARRFLTEAEEVLGHPIETISGIEEARLIYLGVTQTVANPASRLLVLDIGGGSTELIIGEKFQPIQMESLYLGCVSVSRTFFGDGEMSPARWRRAELAALQQFEPLRGRFRGTGWEQAVGSSGTVRAVDAVARAQGWSEEGITRQALERLRDSALKAGHIDRWCPVGLDPERRAVFPGGLVLLRVAFETLGLQQMQASEGALREGLLYDLLGRMEEEDVRSRSVTALADRFHVDWKQAHGVEQTALHLLSQVAEAWNLTSRASQQLLSWVAKLHEVGLGIAHQHHHKHGAYIVAESDLFGFSREEQRVLSTLVRAHRRKFPRSAISALPHRRAQKVERLAILLRLAVIVHRSRSPDPISEPHLAVDGKTLTLTFKDGVLDDHPLTRADLHDEQAHLSSVGYRLDFT